MPKYLIKKITFFGDLKKKKKLKAPQTIAANENQGKGQITY